MRKPLSLLPHLEAEDSHGYQGRRLRKRRRISENPSAIACIVCRGKRIKCDRGKPNCVHCERSGSKCIYNNTTSLNQGAGPDLASNIISSARPTLFQRYHSFSDSAAKSNMEDDPRSSIKGKGNWRAHPTWTPHSIRLCCESVDPCQFPVDPCQLLCAITYLLHRRSTSETQVMAIVQSIASSK